MGTDPYRLKEKIEYEYRCFYLDMMRTSRENIFAHSEEIECKRKLKSGLLKLVENLGEETGKELSLQSNLLESVFCFLQIEKRKEPLENALQRWLVSVRA